MRPPASSTLPGSDTSFSHSEYWVILLRAPPTQLFSSRLSFMSLEKDFVKQGCAHSLSSLKALHSHTFQNVIHRMSSEAPGVLAKTRLLSSVLGPHESQEIAFFSSFKGDFYAHKHLGTSDLNKGQLSISASPASHSIFHILSLHMLLPVEPHPLCADSWPKKYGCFPPVFLGHVPTSGKPLGFLGMFSSPC